MVPVELGAAVTAVLNADGISSKIPGFGNHCWETLHGLGHLLLMIQSSRVEEKQTARGGGRGRRVNNRGPSQTQVHLHKSQRKEHAAVDMPFMLISDPRYFLYL